MSYKCLNISKGKCKFKIRGVTIAGNFCSGCASPNLMNDGGSASYYKLPEGATDLQDLIEAKDMNFSIGNCFKALYRINDDTHSDSLRDLRKIVWFAEREIKRLEKENK